MTIPVVHSTRLNPRAAAENRRTFDLCGAACLNLIGATGFGKTELLEAVVPRLAQELRIGMVVGDLPTTSDAERLAGLGVPVVQVLIADNCHLTAAQVQAALRELPLANLDLVVIENVGSLVCQAAADLGEHLRMALLNVADGAGTIAKCPHAYRNARLVVVTKCDLLPKADFDLDSTLALLRQISPGAEIICTDTHLRAGIGRLAGWLLGYVRAQRTRILMPATLTAAPAIGLPT